MPPAAVYGESSAKLGRRAGRAAGMQESPPPRCARNMLLLLLLLLLMLAYTLPRR